MTLYDITHKQVRIAHKELCSLRKDLEEAKQARDYYEIRRIKRRIKEAGNKLNQNAKAYGELTHG